MANGQSKAKRVWAVNTLPLVYDENCKVLILGTFPGPDSRKNGFYYCNPDNRFWDVMEEIFNDYVPCCIWQRRKYLLRHHIALWDVCASCSIIGAKDETIDEVNLNAICHLLEHSNIKKVFFNGGGIEKLIKNNPEIKAACKNCKSGLSGVEFYILPSTSKRNDNWDEYNHIDKWKELANYLTTSKIQTSKKLKVFDCK